MPARFRLLTGNGGSFAYGKTSSRFQAKPENGKPHQEQS